MIEAYEREDSALQKEVNELRSSMATLNESVSTLKQENCSLKCELYESSLRGHVKREFNSVKVGRLLFRCRN